MTKEDLIKNIGFRKFGVVEYIRNLEQKGLDKSKIQGHFLINELVKSPRVLNELWSDYEELKPRLKWR
tara:strand:- start:59 stop:262 length:204 start_codon:yes stop_codon:yes gene_type:complete